jgi:hypothetical protein
MKTLLVEPVKDSEIANRYYVRAQDMADRLVREWGRPVSVDGKDARKTIAGKRGVIFLQHAYLRAGGVMRMQGATGDHIGLWDSDHLADSASTPFDRAQKVWFWEIP